MSLHYMVEIQPTGIFCQRAGRKGIIDFPALVQDFKENHYQGSLTLEIDYLIQIIVMKIKLF